MRPVTAADAEALHDVFIQPGVRRFVFDDLIIARDVTNAIVARSASLFAERGFGLWVARLTAPATAAERHAIVGFGGFWHFREPPELELLYGVADTHLANGYGIEIARAVVDHGFETLRMPVIRASTDAGHLASQRVLDRLGLTLERRATVNGLDTVFYARLNPCVAGADAASPENRLDES